jgi:hypothetical protein
MAPASTKAFMAFGLNFTNREIILLGVHNDEMAIRDIAITRCRQRGIDANTIGVIDCSHDSAFVAQQMQSWLKGQGFPSILASQMVQAIASRTYEGLLSRFHGHHKDER